MNFWILVTIITLIIGVVAFYPLLKQRQNLSTQKRDSLNKAFYFDRLKEVEQEAEAGIIEDSEQTKLELQQSLLDDIPEHQTQAVSSAKSFGHLGKLWFIALILLIGGISAGIYWNIGSWFSGTMLEMSHKKLDYFYERVKTEETDPLSEQELNQFAMALRVELQKNPNDDKHWFMLGQLGMALDNGQLALDSFAKASKLKPENMQYKLRHAEILLFSEDPKDKSQGELLLKEVIRADHTNTNALSLLAFRAFEQEDYKMAAMTWGMMLKLMPEDDPRRPTIERSIQSALSMIKPGEIKAP
ncbi:c-type cytochrome biogenesis protein CcmI [Glaesserella parasuis]|uniref:c-type cytochrome biogenesis protein CcmI n=1 Tax=Glaesserella parasuis TaxID=738 RepID=UPI0003AC09AC|nr:c-type cytochrome biogenesis protein CcmI [Glaesserella parasuis]AIK90834.1 TPR-repeat-containing protein [Glaesserella parasuis]ATW44805.1 c-type cytochrome biogenesis protein CcmI [Glaesserella parasuis str. Nagasaki]EQA01825.1 cytochrome c-type biogenesis protein CcmH [Glaesserella parasuis str. Nagasaki]EYE72423.1 cytochrome C-type biogenesis protein, TPR repeat-containing protein [Glaesserella parasuis str. Nagasaki]MCT8559262.1 c-type cytochrome biogenesis protein CcmI [Glaesserella p